jgi:hypothetical protein
MIVDGINGTFVDLSGPIKVELRLGNWQQTY